MRSLASLQDEPNALGGLVARTSEGRDIQPGWIEKDFWVTEVIRSVARTQVADATLILKGGTSLLKAHSLIERMSEDVDVLLAYSKSPGRGTREQALKAVHSDVQAHLGLRDAQIEKVGSAEGTRRDIRYTYPGAAAAGGLTAGVLLELGIRGGPSPRGAATFRSMLAEYGLETGLVVESDYAELQEVTIPALAPVRTLVEKLSALHHLGISFPKSEARILRSGRHLYDVTKLIRSPEIARQLTEQGTTAAELAEDVERVSQENGWPYSKRPAQGFAASPMFDAASASADSFEQAYNDARDLVFGSGVPGFQECLECIADSASLL